MKAYVKTLTCLLLLGLTAPAVVAQDAPLKATGFVPAWLNEGDLLSPGDLQSIVASVGAQQPRPDHIAFLVHGLGNSQEASTQQFNDLGPRLSQQYQKANQKVVVVGLQWNSDVPMGLFTAEANYLDMVGRARKVGHGPVRQLLLQLHKSYPSAAFDIYGHSLGCEVTAAAVMPNIQYTDDIAKSSAFEPGQDLKINMVTLAGSDLDYDIWSKSHVEARQDPLVKLAWVTQSPYIGEQDKDQTLKLREMVRGVAAGSAFPKMTTQQYDTILAGRRMVFDNRNIPSDHAFLNYYDDARLARIVPMALSVANPKFPRPKEFAELDMVMAMPTPKSLIPYLDSDNLTVMMYALWRLEQMVCGGSQHLADGTLENIARLMKSKPATVRAQCKESACKSLNQGLFPTEKMLDRAGAPGNW